MNCHFENSLAVRLRLHEANFEPTLDVLSPSWIEATRRNTAKFVFDEFPPDALEDFGLDLVKEDVFSLPFDSCYFEWPYKGSSGRTHKLLSRHAIR